MLRLVFILESVVDAIFGVGLILASGPLLSIFGVSTDGGGTFLAQFLGATLVGFGVLSWSARDWSDTAERRLAIWVFFLTTALGFAVTLRFQLQPGTDARSWAFVVLTALIGSAWAYFAVGTRRR